MCGLHGILGVPRAGLLIGLMSLLALPAAQQDARAGDWPQILGPARDGRATGETLLAQWPAGGPRQVWTYKVGSGFGGPAVAGNRVVVFHRIGENERVEALDVETGRSLWKADFPALYRGGINPDTGPRCVPVIYQDNVYVFGAAGDLHSVALATGAKRWSRSTYEDYNGDEGYFGAGSTPIVADDKLLVNVGGRSGAGLVAFALDTGKTVWQATDERASYSSPTTATIDGQQYAIFVTRMNAVAIDPRSGKVRFQFPFGRTGPTVNAATPLVFDGHLFVTASYGIGAELARISGGQRVTVWSSDDVMSSQYTTSVYDDGYLYGIDGREDIGTARLRCVEAKTGKVKWTEEDFGVAHIILADGKLLALRIDGQLTLAEASPAKYVELASARASNELTRSLPALSNGRLFIRSNPTNGAGELKCLAVGKPKR
jgi:outer membrane protein assembly factor BamB